MEIEKSIALIIIGILIGVTSHNVESIWEFIGVMVVWSSVMFLGYILFK